MEWARKFGISQHQLASVYFDGLAYYIGGGIGGQKSDHFRAFDGRAHGPEGNHGDEIAHHFRRREHLVKGSVDYAGRDGIHARRTEQVPWPISFPVKETVIRAIGRQATG